MPITKIIKKKRTYTPVEKLPHPPTWMLFEADEAKQKMLEQFKTVPYKHRIMSSNGHGGYNYSKDKYFPSLRSISVYPYELYESLDYAKNDPRTFRANYYRKFVAKNIPINKAHKSHACSNKRFEGLDGKSLLKKELFEWCKMNNLPVDRKTKLEEMTKLLWEME